MRYNNIVEKILQLLKEKIMRRNGNVGNRSTRSAKTYRSKKKCEHSGKVRYRTQKDASNALSVVSFHASQGHEGRTEKRTYNCPSCAGWHLTSQPEHTPSRFENALTKYSIENEMLNLMRNMIEDSE